VDNFVGKWLLTYIKVRFHAGFNRLPNQDAKYKAFKINELQITNLGQK